jgi:SAM-dependent methyltransferase
VRGDIQRLPVRPGGFDVVTCIQVLEHFEEPRARELAADLAALLRPGGLLLLSVPVFPAAVIRLKRAADRALVALGRGPIRGAAHPSHFSLASALGLVPPGFRVIDVRGVRLFSLPGKALENHRWWYRLHGWAGRVAPAWTVEVNITARSTS